MDRWTIARFKRQLGVVTCGSKIFTVELSCNLVFENTYYIGIYPSLHADAINRYTSCIKINATQSVYWEDAVYEQPSCQKETKCVR